MKKKMMGRSLVLLGAGLAWVLLGAACGAGGGGGGGSDCNVDQDCNGGDVCKSGRCVGGSSGPTGGTSSGGPCSGAPTGHACGSNGDCCNYQSDSGFCVDFGQGGLCADSCTTDSDCADGCCATTQQGNRVCSPTSFCPVARATDEPCGSSADCASGVCTGGGPGWCTHSCGSNDDCPGGWCVENSSHVFICFPECTSNSQCYGFGVPGISCHSATTVDGFDADICST